MKVRKSIYLVIISLIITAIYVSFIKQNPSVDAEVKLDMEHVNEQSTKSLRFYQEHATLRNDPTDRSKLSEMALALYDTDISDKEAMANIYDLLYSLKTTGSEGSFPAGLNVEITNALLGKNSEKIAYLPIDCPKINQNGELVDNYGAPYWIHTDASGALSVISAGPDRTLFSEDDISLFDDMEVGRFNGMSE